MSVGKSCTVNLNKNTSEIDALFNAYESIDSQSVNTREAIRLYHKWYDSSLAFFSQIFDEKNIHLQKFMTVDNDTNGYGLYGNFDKIRSSYTVLSSLVKNSSSNYQVLDIMSDKVFIVHGHDAGLKNEVARFVENLGLTAIILHERLNRGRTIIQKLLEEVRDVAFAIVLYTPDDEVNSNGKLHFRARQNVIFEHGLLVGLLGECKVCCLCKGEIEIPSDNSGILYTKYDEAGAWKNEVASEMEGVGLTVDLNNLKKK